MRFLFFTKIVLQILLPVLLVGGAFTWYTIDAQALNILTYSDRLSDSKPSKFSNHTMNFTITTDVTPSGYFDFVPPSGFTILSTSTFQARNVELYVNGTPRTSSSTGDATTDEVTITPGSPGQIRYTLNSTEGISNGDELTFRIGNNTSTAFNGEQLYSSTTGTTTLPFDIGILNSASVGTHKFAMAVTGSTQPAHARFVVALVAAVNAGPVDTRETIPPFRFNGAPSGNVGGTTLSVEMSLETDEFAVCKYGTVASTSYATMPNTFSSTGLVTHTQILTGLSNNTSYTFYIRCIDDEGNFNIDDYLITFNILDVPDGTPNTTGSTTGDGTGSGDDGTGVGEGSGGTVGSSDGEDDSTGNSSGGGGSGGGGGGSSGEDDDGNSGGGFESEDAPYRSGDGTVIINGYAFPRSTVTILVDGQKAKTATADSKGKFTVTLPDIARGVYTFGIYATDKNGVKSSTFSTSFSVQGARTSSLSNINVMPSIRVTPDPVDIGANVTFAGFSIPDATITIQNQNDKTTASLKTFTTTSDSSGAWTFETSTGGFVKGTYKVRAKSKQDGGVETNYSDYTYYGVGQEADGQITADLNRDGSVNLVDFSILLFWWGTAGGASDPPADINRDGNVSLTDFSIMLFQWTG